MQRLRDTVVELNLLQVYIPMALAFTAELTVGRLLQQVLQYSYGVAAPISGNFSSL